MAANEDPFMARRQLCNFLRRLRETAELTQIAAAQAANITPYKLARIESGETAVVVNDLLVLLELYGVSSEARQEWIERARVSRSGVGPWNEYKKVVSREFMTFLAHESQAMTLRNFEPSLVPGLLQTTEYARSVLEVVTPDDNIVALAHLRRKRQEQFRDRGQPPEAHFILDEAVLYRRVGGSDVMRRQLQHLRDMAATTNMQIHILRFDEGLYPHWREPFVLFDFHLDVLGTVLYLEKPDGENIIKESAMDDEPAAYLSHFYLLQQRAPADGTIEAIDRALAYIEGG